MNTKRLLGAAAAAALLSNAAWAQAPATPAEAPPPAVIAPTPPIATPDAATPPATSVVTPTAPTPPVAPVAGKLVAKGDIIETLKADGQFKTLLKALETANMISILKTNRNLTIFAPTDAAFAALPAGELDRLMKSPAELQKLMTYHLINATVDSAKIKGAKGGVKTVAGGELVLDGSGDALMANNAGIVQTDVAATNGTVHVVDKVLMPSTAPRLAATTGATADAAATAPAAPPTPKPTAPPEATTPVPTPTAPVPDAPKETSPPDSPQ
ncbi:MAG: fasciclin domain-containing protein [Caulobacter sp.]|nr:fasciclin domain-containing protein [Caulobacter sp.]